MADISVVEYERRTQALQAQMEAHGIGALLLTQAADVFYVTGFLTRFWESPARPWCIVVPAEGAPIAVIPDIGAAPFARTWITDIRTWPAPDPSNNGMAVLADALCTQVPEGGAIGVPMGLETHLRLPLADYADLTARIAPRRMVDATACVQRVREIKSEAEIDAIRTICQIAGTAFDAVPDFAQAGQPLDAVFRAFQSACLGAGADWVSYLAGAAGQGGYLDVISPAAPVPLARGDLLMLDTGAVRGGYFCDFDRNYAIGPASAEAQRVYRALWQSTEDVLAEIRPGLLACDVHAMLCDRMVRHGLTPGAGRLGHGLGLSLTEWPSISAVDRTPLRPGMVLTLEPGADMGAGRMMVHEENLVLRPEGAALLSPRAPAELPEIL